VSEIVSKFPLLATQPHMAVARPDIAPDARAFPYRRYLILYRIEQRGITIVRVVQGAQRLEGIFDN
jgi:toxin ParE1/3/4